MYSMKHPASISRWFFASQWAVPCNYWNFCFALWRVSFHNCKRCAWDSPRDEPVKHFFVSRFSMVWAYQTLIFSLCKTNQSLLLNMRSFEDRKSLIWQLTAATCFVGVREQNFGSYTSAQTIQLAELRATDKEGEEPSQSKTKDTPVSSPTKPWFRREGNLGAQAGRLLADWLGLCSWSLHLLQGDCNAARSSNTDIV